MIFLTKSEVESAENAMRNLGLCPPWELPVEKYPFYLLIALCGKVADMDKRLIEVEELVDHIRDQVYHRCEGR